MDVIAQNQQKNSPNYCPKRQYKKSPLGQEEHQMPITESKKNPLDPAEEGEGIKFRKYKKNNETEAQRIRRWQILKDRG